MNQPYARVNQPYATLTLASALREMFGVQLYKNNARALLSRILSILNLDWLQHARSVRGVYEYVLHVMILVYEVLHNYIVFNFIQAKLSCFVVVVVVVVVVGGGGVVFNLSNVYFQWRLYYRCFECLFQ